MFLRLKKLNASIKHKTNNLGLFYASNGPRIPVRRDLFYLLDYVTYQSENWDLQKKKKNGSVTNW